MDDVGIGREEEGRAGDPDSIARIPNDDVATRGLVTDDIGGPGNDDAIPRVAGDGAAGEGVGGARQDESAAPLADTVRPERELL